MDDHDFVLKYPWTWGFPMTSDTPNLAQVGALSASQAMFWTRKQGRVLAQAQPRDSPEVLCRLGILLARGGPVASHQLVLGFSNKNCPHVVHGRFLEDVKLYNGYINGVYIINIYKHVLTIISQLGTDHVVNPLLNHPQLEAQCWVTPMTGIFIVTPSHVWL